MRDPKSPGTGNRSLSRGGQTASGEAWIIDIPTGFDQALGSAVQLRAGGGRYLVAIVMIFTFGLNVYNAWVLIAEVSD